MLVDILGASFSLLMLVLWSFSLHEDHRLALLTAVTLAALGFCLCSSVSSRQTISFIDIRNVSFDIN